MKTIVKIIVFCLLFANVSGCVNRGVTIPPDDPSLETGVEGKTFEDLSPRAQASLRLTNQARALLENGRVSDAIMTLEKAINLNPGNGLNYYYLAEAWIDKGDLDQATKFNGLAASGLEGSPAWTPRVKEQRERIDEMR